MNGLMSPVGGQSRHVNLFDCKLNVTRLVKPELGDQARPSKFQIFDELGQSLTRNGIGGFQCPSKRLRQPSVEFFAFSAGHLSAPANPMAIQML